MRKSVLGAAGACVLASLLLFLAPVFRQAFQVSLAQWHHVIHIGPAYWNSSADSALESIEKKAEQNHDAEALAFVASRESDAPRAARLAGEAVHLDPNLTWVYATAGLTYDPSSGMDRVSALRKWDPENALSYLLEAQKIGVTVAHSKDFPLGKIEESPAWEKAMAAAFQSPKLEDYGDRQVQLDRRVLARYRVEDPFQVPSDEDSPGFPSYGVWYSSLYAKSLLEAGGTLDSHGESKAALEKYSTVARFCQIAGPLRGIFLREQCKEAYEHLAKHSDEEGSKAEAALYIALGNELWKNTEKELALRRNRYRGSYVAHWDAFLVRLSGLLILLFSTVLVLCMFGVAVRSRSVRLSSLHASGSTLALVFVSAVGVLVSSAVLFVSYWPYSEVVKRFLTIGDAVGLSDLSRFLGDVSLPIGSQNLGGSWYVGSQYAAYYFWFVVAIVCVLALLVATLRFFQTRGRATATT